MLNRDFGIMICSRFVNCELWSCDMNSTLGSVVPLAMFIFRVNMSKTERVQSKHLFEHLQFTGHYDEEVQCQQCFYVIEKKKQYNILQSLAICRTCLASWYQGGGQILLRWLSTSRARGVPNKSISFPSSKNCLRKRGLEYPPNSQLAFDNGHLCHPQVMADLLSKMSTPGDDD